MDNQTPHPLSEYYNPPSPPQSPQSPASPSSLLSPAEASRVGGHNRLPLLLLPILVITTFILSFFFFSNQRQPKSLSRASSPSPTLSLSNLSHISNQTPTSTQSSGFAGILNPSSSHPEIQRFDIEASGNAFKPNSLTAYKNQILVINIRATDQSYDFTLPDYGISKFITSGTSATLEFQATNFGEYVFFCGTPCNNSDTARGLLTIKP